jgi:hypothetical protein
MKNLAVKSKDDIYSLIERHIGSFSKKIDDWFVNYFKTNPTNGSKPQLLVGTDSSYANGRTIFTVAIVVNTCGHGAEYIYKNFKVFRYLPLFEKIYSEAHTSVLVASMLKQRGHLEKFSEIIVHVDANSDENAKSSQYYHSVIGMVKGSGFNVVGKPYAYAATSVADRHCKG